MTWPTSVDYGALGVYSLGMATGTMAAGLAAGSEIFQFRWTDTTKKALIREIVVSAGGIVGFTAGLVVVDAVMARAFTAAGTGGATATLTTNNAKLRTDMSTTALGEVRVATTAALGTGTKTLDAQAFAAIAGSTSNVAGTVVIPPTLLFLAPEGEQPLVLEQNEGFVIRAQVPATGTWTAAVTVKWSELTEF